MILVFTPEEREWLDTEEFNWHVKEGAPADIRKSIEAKLKASEEDDNESDASKAVGEMLKKIYKEKSN